jgi:hypothetical protein
MSAAIVARVLKRTTLSPSGCLLWLGAVNSAGYPTMRLGREVVLVTRFLLAHTVRPFKRAELACHECDTPRCIRIHEQHVHHGTYSRNLKDAWARRRRSRPCTFIERGL